MKRRLKRILSAAFACVLILSLLPVGALADTTNQTVYVYAQVVDNNGEKLSADALNDLGDLLGNSYTLNSDGWMTIGTTTMDLSQTPKKNAVITLDEATLAAAQEAVKAIKRYSQNQGIPVGKINWSSLAAFDGAADLKKSGEYCWHLDGKITVADVVGLTVTAQDVEADYDGQPHGADPAVKVEGAAAGQTVETTPTIDYADANGKPISDTPVNAGTYTANVSVSLTGNYSWITATDTATVTIAPKPVTVSLTAQDKVYDGTTAADGTLTVSGALPGEDVTARAADITFCDKDVGTGKTVTASGITLNNSNYKLVDGSGNATASGMANITAKELTVAADATNRAYDGTTSVAVSIGALEGVISGDTVSIENHPTTGTMADADIGANKPVTIAELALAGTDAKNYTLTQPTIAVTITQRAVTITVNDAEKFYDEDDPAFTYAITAGSLVNADDLGTIICSRTMGESGDESVGTYQNVLTASYAANSNYTVTVIPGSFTIRNALVPAGAYVEATGGSQVYSGQPFTASAEVKGAAGYTIQYSADGGATWTTDAPSVTDVADGTVTVSVKATRTGYQDLTGSDVTIAVTPRTITIAADSASKVYDGEALTKDSYTNTVPTEENPDEGLVSGQTVTATVAGSQTKIGQSDNTASNAVIKDGETDVTGNYSISYKEGTLTVTAAAGVEVTKEVITESGILGCGEISWKVTVTNNGSSTAYGLKLVDSIEGAVITAETTGDEAAKDPGSFDLEAGASAAFIVAYAPTRIGTYTNKIQVTQPTDNPQNPDWTLDEDTADDVEVAEPVTDVSVSKDRATGASVTVGGTVKWIITIRNGGNVPACVTVADKLDGAVLTLNGEMIAADTVLTVPAGNEIRIEASYKTTSNDAGKTLINKVVVTEPKSEPDGTEKEYTDEDEGTWIEYPYDPPVAVPDPTVKVKGLNTVDHVTYIIGVGDNKFNPTGTITRAEIAAIYFRLMTDEFRSANWSTDNRFSDVPNNAWYTMAILTLDNAGVITDSDDGSFRPDEPITRAELAVLAAQFCTVTGNIPKTSFLDVPADYWAAKEIALVEYAGWIEGCEGYFRPDGTLNRAEAVTIVNRMLQRGVEAENMLPDMVTFVDNTPDQWYYEAVQEAANCHSYTRTAKLLTGETFRGEKWTALLEATDWAALEKAWIEANS